MFLKPAPTADQHARSLETARTFGVQRVRDVLELLRQCPAYAVTPLLTLDALARQLGIQELAAKDERSRLGLTSFKALGGVYAVLTMAADAASRELGRSLSPAELVRGNVRLTRPLVFATASAGNHGCAVAAGARLVGAHCVVFVPTGVPAVMLQSMAARGAELVHVSGVYEDAVAQCRERAASSGWQLVSDTSWPGYREPAARVQLGYSVTACEVREALTEAPTHVFVQAGVGGLAAAWAASLAAFFQPANPQLLVVEPERAACLLASARAGERTRIAVERPTNMGRLQCYEPSLLAWEQLSGLTSAFVSVSDAQAEQATALLKDAGVSTSPSGAAGLAGLLRVLGDPLAREAVALGPKSRVLILVTEADVSAAS
jgi:diaminopropionate ammonia-lyase